MVSGRRNGITGTQGIKQGKGMIKEETVFILGAGASCPYGYPDGKELREQICSNFARESKTYFLAQANGQPPTPGLSMTLRRAKEFEEIFHNSSTKSIDLFLARNPEFMVLGKWAIIFRIFTAERNSTFREKMRNRNQDWYSYLFERLTDKLVTKEDYVHFGENKASFITFNYDRSLEHFLYESLRNSFNGIEAAKLQEQINKLRVIHVFGQIAGLEWQEVEDRIEYRRNINLVDVQRLADNLRIIYEENENSVFEEAHKLISEAKRIFFLGFGYAKENCELLKIPVILNTHPEVYGTALGFTEKERFSIIDTFPRIIGPVEQSTQIKNVDSLALLREYL